VDAVAKRYERLDGAVRATCSDRLRKRLVAARLNSL
jgi:hypothetical protein